MRAIFRNEEESAYVFWAQIPVQLTYQRSLYECIDQVVAMAFVVHSNEEGATLVELQNQILDIRWELHWDRDELVIKSLFSARDDLYAPYAETLNRHAQLRMPRAVFLSEWHTLLHQIVVAIREANIEIEDGTERRKWELLQRLDEQIEGYGQLYTRRAS
ncbi:MAG: hypothetical protein AAFV88_03955 [Planctomycetota bacterium]